MFKKVKKFAKSHKNKLVVAGISFLVGWCAHIYVDEKIPFSYKTDNPILDLLGAVGVRDYADI